MLKHTAVTRARIQHCQDELVKPAVYGLSAPLEIAVYQCADPIPYKQALRQKFKPVSVGFRFGPKWSTAWFKITGRVPAAMAGKTVVLRFKSETEALVYRDGVPAQGMERNHDDYVLLNRARGGERVVVFVECGVNTFFGAGGGSRKDSRAPVNSISTPGAALPGHLQVCELATVNGAVRDLANDLEFLRSLERALPEKSPRKRQILFTLNAAVNALDQFDVPGTAAAARQVLSPALAAKAASDAPQCFAVGHAHIDTAWLWPLRETVRKCSRTFATQVALMEEYPDYVFQASQAQLYAFTKANYPQLFDRIKRKVKTGQWEAGGAMWVEADCNLTSGESLVRQILHGTDFWLREFGPERGAQKYLWLPDVFGYSAALPQILKQAGIEAFLTQKISWNQTNAFPHHTFWWEGIDGTRLFTHFLPTDTYNGSNVPEELIRGAENNRDADRANLFLNAYGFGDGGGGPTRQHIEMAHRAADCDGVPRTRCGRVDDFVTALKTNSRDLQTWVGELYLELHRGTYTTQARNKAANRRAECLLHDAEFFCALRPEGMKAYPAAELDAAWKTVLLNQFHDIIPGSSITWVYEDSQEQYQQVHATAEKCLVQAARAWVGQMDTTAADHPLAVFNTMGWVEAGLITIAAPRERGRREPVSLRDLEGRVVSPLQRIETAQGPAYVGRVTEVPSCGYAVFDVSTVPAPVNPTEAVAVAAAGGGGGGAVLENRLVRVEIDAVGRVTRLFDKVARREVVKAGAPANQLVLYEDRPVAFGAWDIDAFYLEKPAPVTTPGVLRVAEAGPVRATVEVRQKLGRNSTLTQRISLSAESMLVRFDSHVEWQETNTLLRVLHPVGVHSLRATFEIQFGHTERPTHFNTSWDWARFEVCAQKWADLSEPGYGVALLNTGKYGHSCHGNVLGLSLLRSPTPPVPEVPDPTADRGSQDYTYALLPHAGDLRSRPLGPGSSVIEQAYRLNFPLRSFAESSHRGPLPPRFSAVSCTAENVIVETIKKAEKSNDVIVRLYEAHGGRGEAALIVHVPFTAAAAVDLLERPTELYGVRAETRTVRVGVTPFALRTVMLKR